MEQTQQKEHKWGFWLYMLNFLSLDSIVQLLIRKNLHVSELLFIHHLLSFGIAFGLTIGISYVLRPHAWKYKVWSTGAIVVVWLLAHILLATS